MKDASLLQLLGAGGFGALVGWYIYYVNRYRTDTVQLSDIVTLLGAIGGAAVLALFPAKTDLFGAYGIGLFVGFFGYFLVLVALVISSKEFGVNWFLDGRRGKLAPGEFGERDPGRAMIAGGRGDFPVQAMAAVGRRGDIPTTDDDPGASPMVPEPPAANGPAHR